jgi:hypothetical protein
MKAMMPAATAAPIATQVPHPITYATANAASGAQVSGHQGGVGRRTMSDSLAM